MQELLCWPKKPIQYKEKNQNYDLKKNLQFLQQEKKKKTTQPVWTELGSTYHIQHQCTVLSLPKTPDLGLCMKTNQELLHIMEIIDYVNFIGI